MRVHGGRWADYYDEHDRLPLVFSSNVSPLGMPEGARAAAVEALSKADRYPDPDCRALRRALAARYGLASEDLICGNGAGDLIDRLALALRPQHALITAPTFGEYRAALERVVCTVGEWPLDEGNGYLLSEGILPCIDHGLDLLVLCEPNNPTGRTSHPALLRSIAARCAETGTLLIADESFLDYVDSGDSQSLLGLVRAQREPAEGAVTDARPASPQVVVLRAFTKFYGMAGLRLGWCASTDRGLLAAMVEAGQPWPVSSVAQAAGIAALGDEAYATRLRRLVGDERPRLAAALAALGCRVVPGEANYLLFHINVHDLDARLEARGVLIRSCADFVGLERGWYRVAVRTAEENDQLIAVLGKVLS